MSIAPAPVALATTPAKAGNIVAVASGKGGVGKTWLSITLAHALARLGRRTLLFDGDLGLANVDIQLGLLPDQDLGAVLAGRLSLDAAMLDYEAGGFSILAGRSGCGRLAALPPPRLARLGGELVATAAGFDHVVLDLGAGLDRIVRQLAALAGTCVVVTTDEPTALTDAYAFIKVTQMERPGTDLRVVVNMAASQRDGEKTYAALFRACSAFLKSAPPLLGVVRRDAKVRDAIRRQAPLLTRSPNSDAAADVEAIVGRLLGLPG